MTATDTTAADTPATHIELAVTGMTCAACAMRIEKKLNRLDGVSATVNYATEKATVAVTDSMSRGRPSLRNIWCRNEPITPKASSAASSWRPGIQSWAATPVTATRPMTTLDPR